MYNLACYEATLVQRLEPDDGNKTAERALDALSKAFFLVHGDRRQELVRWAERDPSLRPIHSWGAFHALIARYKIPDERAVRGR
jgi:hypothetical protein